MLPTPGFSVDIMPGCSADAPVTPTTGPALGFWLRPFNYFDVSAAVYQPDLVYIPALTSDQVQAATNAARAGSGSFTLLNEGLGGNSSANNSAAAGGGNGPTGTGLAGDNAVSVAPQSMDALIAARRGIQPFVGVALGQQCLPVLATPAFNGTYAPLYPTSPIVAEAAAAAAADAGANSSAAGASTISSGDSGEAVNSTGGAMNYG